MARGQLEHVPVSCISHHSPTTSGNLEETLSDRLAGDKRSNDMLSLRKEIVSQTDPLARISPSNKRFLYLEARRYRQHCPRARP